MSITPGKVRVNFEIDNELNRRWQNCVQWGSRGPTLRMLVERMVESAEEHGQIMIGAILDGNFTFAYKPPAVPKRDTSGED